MGHIADEFAMTRTWSFNLSSGTTRLTNPCNRASTEKFLLRLCFLFSLNPLKMVLYKYFYISDSNTKFNHRCVVQLDVKLFHKHAFICYVILGCDYELKIKNNANLEL